MSDPTDEERLAAIGRRALDGEPADLTETEWFLSLVDRLKAERDEATSHWNEAVAVMTRYGEERDEALSMLVELRPLLPDLFDDARLYVAGIDAMLTRKGGG